MRRIYTVETLDCKVDENGYITESSICPDFDITCFSSLLEAMQAFKKEESNSDPSKLIYLNAYDIPLPEGESFNLRYDEFKKKYFDFYDEDKAVLYACSYLLSDVDEERLTCEASFENNILEEEVRYKSEFFSMRKVCERAGVNYSTFRGFKNNKQYFSAEKLLKLLDTMKAISGESWNDEIKAALESL